MKGTKTVWVLGSGFSKSLGAPLLYELFGDKAEQETKEAFPVLGPRDFAYYLFRKHRGVLWEHAEDYLDFIDTALLPDSPRRRILNRHLEAAGNQLLPPDDLPPSIEELRKEAILTVAAECSTFTEIGDVRSEAWAPYVDWACKLGDSDSIVTFNYDLVLETVGTDPDVRAIGVETVAFPKNSDGHLHRQHGASVCEIFKLHGSADWAINDGGVHKRLSSLEEIVGEGDFGLLIATPGATKQRLVSKLLSVLWTRAEDALAEAEVIVFIGYRFPPSDSEARTRLLRAIEKNKSPLLTIHTVLGADLHHKDVVRLKGLLTHALKAAGRIDADSVAAMSPIGKLPLAYRVVTQPLFAEDFLTVVRAEGLHESQLAATIKQSRNGT